MRSALKWIADLFSVGLQIAPVENDDSYDELKRDAKTCLSLMSQGLLYPEQIPMVLCVLHEVRIQPRRTQPLKPEFDLDLFIIYLLFL